MRLEFQELEVEECISIEDAKFHCKIDTDDEDDYIESLITTARVYCENWCGTALVPQRSIAYYDSKDKFIGERLLRLPHLKVISIVSVNSYDDDDTESLFAGSNYRLSGDRLILKNSASFPSDVRDYDSLAIEFISGYGTSEVVDDEVVITETVPSPVKQAMLELILNWHENRAAVYDQMNTSAPQFSMPMSFGVMAKLQPYKRYSI